MKCGENIYLNFYDNGCRQRWNLAALMAEVATKSNSEYDNDDDHDDLAATTMTKWKTRNNRVTDRLVAMGIDLTELVKTKRRNETWRKTNSVAKNFFRSKSEKEVFVVCKLLLGAIKFGLK